MFFFSILIDFVHFLTSCCQCICLHPPISHIHRPKQHIKTCVMTFFSSFHFLQLWTIHDFAARQHFLPLFLLYSILLSCCRQCLSLMYYISLLFLKHMDYTQHPCYYLIICIPHTNGCPRYDFQTQRCKMPHING